MLTQLEETGRTGGERERLATLFAYSAWANDRILMACEALDEAQWTRDLGNSFPSIADTVAHIAGAEWIWLERWRGNSPTALREELNGAPLARLRDELAGIREERAQLLASLPADALEQPLAYRNTAGTHFAEPLWQQMRHVVNHSAYHRGQIVTMLRQLGIAPPPTDLIVYFREAPPSQR